MLALAGNSACRTKKKLAKRDELASMVGLCRLTGSSQPQQSGRNPIMRYRKLRRSAFATVVGTSKERDSETGNDDFGARYDSNRFGRWLSADWSNVAVPVPYANLTNPQTLNLYAMVSDDPESFADL